MGIRNGTRVFAGNFILVWKHLLYLIFTTLVTVALFMVSSIKIWEMLDKAGWVQSFNSMLEMVYVSPNDFAGKFSSVATELFFTIKNNFSIMWPSYLLSVATVLFVPAFLHNVGQYALGAVLYNRTKALLNKSYFTTLVSTLGRSSLYSLLKIAVSLPFLVLLLASGYCYGVLANNWLNATLLFPIFIMVIILILSLRYTLLIGFLPEAQSGEGSIWSAFSRALDEYTKEYPKKVLHYYALFIVEFGLVVFISVFSVGVGILVALPSITLLNLSCSFAVYYAERGENYYAGEGIIIKPISQK